jgi:hypothetical protein
MTKKIILGFGLLLIIVVAFIAWSIAGPGTAFDGKYAIVHIPTKNNGRVTVQEELKKETCLHFHLHLIGWPQNLIIGVILNLVNTRLKKE